MAKKPIERVAKLRASLERQAQVELGAVQSSMHEALGHMLEEVCEQTPTQLII